LIVFNYPKCDTNQTLNFEAVQGVGWLRNAVLVRAFIIATN